jgi:hypothetical protein
MAFKMKGSSLYGKLNLNRGGQANRPDGRAKSSAFQKDGAPFLGAVMGAVGKVKGVVDKVKKVKGTIDKVKDVASKIPGFKKHGEPEKSGAPMCSDCEKASPAKDTKYFGQNTSHDEVAAVTKHNKKHTRKKNPYDENHVQQGRIPVIRDNKVVDPDQKASLSKKKKGAPKKTDPKDKRSDSEKKIQSKLDNRSSTYDHTPVSNSTVDVYRKTTSDGKDVNRTVSVSGDQTTRESIHKDKQTSHDNETKWLNKSLKGAKKARRKSDREIKRIARNKKNAKKKADDAQYRKDRGLPPILER